MGKAKKAASKIREVKVHTNALRDIEEIGMYIANNMQQPVNSVKVNLVIERTIDRIVQHPFAFKEC